MMYPPGSFSKNFAWHGTGLRKLHNSIRSGFRNSLTSVPRNKWRADSEIDDTGLELIPVNFFLHNAASSISVDELVFQAVKFSHTIRFDRLALFALHLNRVGKPPGGRSRPAMWANEFVRESLWFNGLWRSDALNEASLDSFIADRMAATSGVRQKCRSNYRHLFELCEYLPARLPQINSGAEHWIAPALFLTWDRAILDSGAKHKAELLSIVRDDEIYKLLGISEPFTMSQADSLADLYLRAGATNRFVKQIAAVGQVEIEEEANTEWVDQDESDNVVERRLIETHTQVRDRKKAASLKRHYMNTCLVCGERLQIADNKFYSEAAHIKPVGKPQDGPDKISNMLVLCPNHHMQFDRGVLRIQKKGKHYELDSKVKGDKFHKKKLVLQHTLDDDLVNWHWRWFGSKRG